MAVASLKGAASREAAAKVGSRSSPELVRLLRLLVSRDLTPAIVFSFSRKVYPASAAEPPSITYPERRGRHSRRMATDEERQTHESRGLRFGRRRAG